jgi:hypothetical protein
LASVVRRLERISIGSPGRRRPETTMRAGRARIGEVGDGEEGGLISPKVQAPRALSQINDIRTGLAQLGSSQLSHHQVNGKM